MHHKTILTALSGVAATAAIAIPSHAATTVITYDFTSGMQGWTNQTFPTSGAPAYGVFSNSSTGGQNALDIGGSRNNAGDVPLLARSPVFSLVGGSAENEITFRLRGGD